MTVTVVVVAVEVVVVGRCLILRCQIYNVRQPLLMLYCSEKTVSGRIFIDKTNDGEGWISISYSVVLFFLSTSVTSTRYPCAVQL